MRVSSALGSSERMKDTNCGSQIVPKSNPIPESEFLFFQKKWKRNKDRFNIAYGWSKLHVFCTTPRQTEPNKCIHINRRLERIHSTRMYCKAESLRCLTVTHCVYSVPQATRSHLWTISTVTIIIIIIIKCDECENFLGMNMKTNY